ncbi:MAG: glycosyltransferase family 9 protein [Candidatus Binataceae bacterium]
MGTHTHDRVLVIFPGALGDLICFAPALQMLARRHRGAALELMAREELARFAVDRLDVAQGHSIDRREVAALFSGSADTAGAEFFSGFVRIHSFFAFANAEVKITLTRLARGRVNFHPFRPADNAHISVSYMRALGDTASSSPHVDLHLKSGDFQAAHRTLARSALEPHKFILLLPGSGSQVKNWPAANYVSLAQRLASRIMPVFLLGPAEEAASARFNTCGFVTLAGHELGEVAALASLSYGFIGNDSGISHLASIAGAPGLVLFGPTEPHRWRPLGKVEVLRRDPLQALEVREVLAAAERMFG